MSAVLRQLMPKERKEKSHRFGPFLHKPILLHTRGIIHQYAQVFENFENLIPHAKHEQTLPSREFNLLGEIASDRHCDTIGVFETKHRKYRSECYFWIISLPNGPSMKFFVRDAESIQSLRLIGNCLKGSRPILQFDPKFNERPELEIAKCSLLRLFSVPYQDPHSKPFVDRTMVFVIDNGLIVIRHYQIHWNDGSEEGPELAEIGPRVVLELHSILQGVCKGGTIWKNGAFVSPYAEMKEVSRQKAARRVKARDRQADREERKLSLPQIDEHPYDDLFIERKT